MELNTKVDALAQYDHCHRNAGEAGKPNAKS
jgi:hypothetical protein